MKIIIRCLVLSLSSLALLLTATASTSAGDMKIVSYRQVLTDEAFTFPFPAANRCGGEPRTIKLKSDGSFRITMQTSGPNAGYYWITPIQRGTFQILPVGPDEPIYAGRFELQPDSYTPNTEEVTFFLHLVGSGSDGSTLDARLLERLSVSQDRVTISMASPAFLSYELDCT